MRLDRRIKLLAVALVLTALVGCHSETNPNDATASPAPSLSTRPSDMAGPTTMTSEWPAPPDGLLQSDREILSDSDLARVKAAGLALPAKLKLGVTRMSRKTDLQEA